MMKGKALAIIAVVVFFTACTDQKLVKSQAPSIEDVLVNRGFIDNNTYRIVCKGYPQQGLEGIQKVESSKRAALLNAYYFVQNYFDDFVAPDRDGKAVKFDIFNDYAVVHYIVTKHGLRKKFKKR